MALTATYSGGLSRVILSADALGASATYAVFDLTVNGTTYSTVRGGGSVTVGSQLANLNDFEFPCDVAATYRVRSYSAANVLQQTFTVAITVQLTAPWLKSVGRPFLNRQVEASDASDVSYTARAGIFPVIGRTDPVAVTDSFSVKSYQLSLRTFTKTEADLLRILVASGDVLYLQTPPDFPSPGGYFVCGDVTEGRQGMPWADRWFTLPLTKVAAPGADVAATLGTWQTVINTYPTWTALIAAKATWADVLLMVGDPSEVEVP